MSYSGFIEIEKKQLLKNTATFRWKLSFLRTLFNQGEFGDVSFAF